MFYDEFNDMRNIHIIRYSISINYLQGIETYIIYFSIEDILQLL